MWKLAKSILSWSLCVAASSAAAVEGCNKPYWPYSEFVEAPGTFGVLLRDWPDGAQTATLIANHHDRVRGEFRQHIGPCRPNPVARALDWGFGGLFSANLEERYRATNGFYKAWSNSCVVMNWDRIPGTASPNIGITPHVVRLTTTSDLMCGESGVFMPVESGLVALSVDGGSCDINSFSAQNVRGISISSIFSGVHSAESIMERLFEYIGAGPQLTLAPYEPRTNQHAQLGIFPVSSGRPIFPTILPELPQVLPYGREHDGRYFLLYPTLTNPRGDNNGFFPTEPSGLRVDVIDVTDQELRRRQLRDHCLRQQENMDQPIFNFN